MTIMGCMEWLEEQTLGLSEEVSFIFGNDDPPGSQVYPTFQVRKTGETGQHFFNFNRRVEDLDIVIYIENTNGYIASETEFQTLTKIVLDWIYDNPTMGGNCVVATPIGMVEVEQQGDSTLQLRVLTLEIRTNL